MDLDWQRGRPVIWQAVEKGVVTLTGRVTLPYKAGVVASEVERRKAEMIALSTFGVLSVENALRLDED